VHVPRCSLEIASGPGEFMRGESPCRSVAGSKADNAQVVAAFKESQKGRSVGPADE
jgi:hypothetical protein